MKNFIESIKVEVNAFNNYAQIFVPQNCAIFYLCVYNVYVTMACVYYFE